MESFTVDKFNGGITDGYLAAAPNYSASLDNFLLDTDAKPYVRPGIACYSTRVPVSGASQWVTGIYNTYFFVKDTLYYLFGSTFVQSTGPESNVAVPGKGNQDLESALTWNNQIIYTAGGGDTVSGASVTRGTDALPHRTYITSLGPPIVPRALTLGLPALASAPTVTSTGGTGSNYVYAFHYYYQFTDYLGNTFEEKGAVTQVALSNVGAPNVNNVNITSIPALANTSLTNYDVSTSLKIKVFRTINNGSTLYALTSINNGTTSYTDSTTDATLQTASVVYTDGGLLEYSQPTDETHSIVEVDETFWYADSDTLRHSIQGAPGAVLAESEYVVGAGIRALGSIIGFPIVFTPTAVYRVEGKYDEFGDGGFELKKISDTAGCAAKRSVVSVPGGLVWAGNGGFYFTNGYEVKKISEGMDGLYAQWVHARMVGAYDPKLNIVFWTAVYGPSGCDKVVALHLNFGLKPDSVFTTCSSQGNVGFVSLSYIPSPGSTTAFHNNLMIGDGRGYFCYFSDLLFTDAAIDINAAPSAFKKRTIIYRYESAGMDLGDDTQMAYCSELRAKLSTETDIAVQFYTRRDDGGPWASLSEYRQDGGILWGISEYPWNGSADTVLHDWNSQPVTEGKRHMPATTLRSGRRQIAITNAKTYIARSDDYTTVTTATVTDSITGRVTKTVTLNSASYFWPGDCEFYEIYFNADSYVQGYTILSRDSDTQITIIDPLGTMPTTSTGKWQMRGYRKFERLHLLSYSIMFDREADSQAANRGTSGLVNA